MCDTGGKTGFISIHFPLSIATLKDRIQTGLKCVVDVESKCVRFKRTEVAKDPQEEPKDKVDNDKFSEVPICDRQGFTLIVKQVKLFRR